MENSTATQVHGHAVMEMMIHSGESFTRESLIETITEKFGADTRFYTCSAENLTPEGIVDFLTQRGKFIDKEDGFTTDPSRICSH